MRWWWRLSQGLARAGANIFGKFRVFGLENLPRSGGVLLAANHQSVLDPVLVAMVLPREMHFMARRSLFRNPIFRAIIVSYNAFAIERDTADVKGVKEAIARLEAGSILLVFPEGTRTGDGSIGRMKPGIGMLAERAAVPIVPVLIDGAYEMLPKGARFPRQGRISIVFGKPLPPSDDKTAVNRIQDAVVGLKGELSGCRIASS
ncbi:MAG TPA: lysophospholipid acyltransferase family protein [Planctomycetota bacterium]|nr:lysophospholipid acyltransferase family protein [Planctomycetota bacterium]